MAGTVLHYAKIPSSAELCCIVAQIDLTEIQDSSAKSHFHWKTMKCRLIIHTMQDAVIASPVFETIGSIYVIVGVEFFKTRVLQNNLKEMNMTWSTPRPVTPDVYANCLRYSLLFALAPRWNRVGQFLVNEKEFLTNTENNTATRFTLTLQSKYDKNIEACLSLQPLKLRLCNVTLEELCIPQEVIAHFMADPNGMIDVTSFGNHRVTVLPSLKRGKLMAILKKIPASSPFKNYGELRRHWKNMYGYRLPETDNGLIYYDIYFPMSMDGHFLYPNICVRSQILETPYFGNRDLLVQSFLIDIHETLPIICGLSLKIVTDSHKIENSSFATGSSSQRAIGTIKEEPKTAEPMENVAIHGHSTTRLSMTCLTPKYQLRRDSSTLMSPTPSLRGALSNDETRTEKLRGILSTIAKFRETATSSRLPRVKEDTVETQNQCPNVVTGEKKTKLKEATKSLPMEIELEEPRIFMPRSNFETNSQAAKTPIFGRPVTSTSGPSTSSYNNNVEMKNKTKIESSEIVSKYFDTSEKPNKRTDRTISQNSEKITLSEKLLRNITTYDEKMSDD